MDYPDDESLLKSITDVVMDFNGTLADAGNLLSNVRDRLEAISKKYRLVIATSDTFKNANENLKNLGLKICIVKSGIEKRDLVRSIKNQNCHVATVGNGRNDIEMFKEADFSIAVIGPEGAYSKLLEHSTIVVANINHAFDLLENTQKMTATLKS